MCRNIKPLFNFEPPATEAEVEAAALQFVRKVSGYRAPAPANQAAFDAAVAAVAATTSRLLDELTTTATPKNREREAEKRRQRHARRFAPPPPRLASASA